MRFFIAVTLLFCACAHLVEKPAQETPGAKLFLRDPNGDGRRQWFLQVVDAKATQQTASLIFDEEDPTKAAPPRPVVLTRKPFVPREPEQGYYASYHLMVVEDNPPAGRGVVYYDDRRMKEAYPLLWWGLEADPGFDDASPADNWAKLQSLFKK